jgi:diaminopimelate decarboxylase
MDHFETRDGVLHAEDIALPVLAEAVGTPLYVYSRATLTRHARVFRDALKVLPRFKLAFAVKSNPNLAVLKVLAAEGYGADVVSAGEMERALAAGMAAQDVVFSGVGKTHAELTRALEAGIGQFNLESEEEGLELAEIAVAMGKVATCALRVNPDVDAGTHGKISTGKAENKFGVPFDRAGAIYARLAQVPGLAMRGLTLHIGSQLSSLDPLEAAFTKIGTLLAAIRAEGTASPTSISAAAWACPTRPARCSPARSLCRDGRARVEGLGHYRHVRAGPRDHRQYRRADDPRGPRQGRRGRAVGGRRCGDERSGASGTLRCLARFCRGFPFGRNDGRQYRRPDLRSSDTFAMNRTIDTVARGDLAVFRTAGAYGATMANTYNSRPLVPEVMVDGDKWAIVAERIEPATILAAERVPEWLA